MFFPLVAAMLLFNSEMASIESVTNENGAILYFSVYLMFAQVLRMHYFATKCRLYSYWNKGFRNGTIRVKRLQGLMNLSKRGLSRQKGIMSNATVQLFKKIGLSEEKAKETAGNKKIAPILENIVRHVLSYEDSNAFLGQCTGWSS